MPNGAHKELPNQKADVVILGGGLAGLAAAIHLSRAGLAVVCLEQRETIQHIVGESLDWSAPDLLAQLGLPMEELLSSGAATYKRHIVISDIDGKEEHYKPGPWLAKPPFNVEVRTMHLDRDHIHKALTKILARTDVQMIHEKAVGFETRDGRILAVETSAGRRFDASWFIDAAGAAASVLGRELQIPSVNYGPRKVAIWGHVPTDKWVEGTNLYMLNSADQYMEWLWEIPISPGVSSLGYVAPGSKVKILRAHGLSNAEIWRKQLENFPKFAPLLQFSESVPLAVTSFLCRTYTQLCGKNWILIGEAGSQSDPITGNGVTAALRHASEASAMISATRDRDSFPLLARYAYNLRHVGLGRFFNSLIEKIFYEPSLRGLIGVFRAGDVYTVPAWTTNLIYARTRPRRILGTLILGSALLTMRMAAWAAFRVSRQLNKRHRAATRPLALEERKELALHNEG
ncbi:flavin-dependent dehydrogenase [Granulicella aggregans]|uniref:Flavin-dependent dehydrogenase n=1 Tax=Granulicella aggregans TaxID=474949 RepID=A0A7W8E2K1_9BACT|nr:FAD-dependent oxidoreductase [Granulicella aggregans]MBB5056958.1 flavin-dependent dehydrogenase [Granulicella aggregans]